LFLPVSVAGHASLVLLSLVGLACLGWMLWLAATTPTRRDHRWFMLAAALLVLAGVFYKFRGDLGQIRDIGNGDRYFYLPKVVLLWSLVCELKLAGWRRWTNGALLALSLLASATSFRSPDYVDYHWPEHAARIRAGEPVTVPINPPGWTVSFPRRR
jgi:hypothetical protein